MSASSVLSLRNERDSFFDQLQQANKTILHLRQRIIQTTEKLSVKCEEQGEFAEAASLLDHVIKQVEELDAKNDEDSNATTAEISLPDLDFKQLEYRYRKGKLRFLQSQNEDAEHDIQSVLTRRQDLLGDHMVQEDVTRETQLLLCEILRSQDSNVKRRKAELFYAQHNLLTQLTIQNQRDRDWRVRNAFYFACVQAEMENFSLAVIRMREVWPEMRQTTTNCSTSLEVSMVEMLNLLQQKGQLGCVDSLLDLICRDPYNLTSPRLIALIIERSDRLHNIGRHTQSGLLMFKVWRCPETSREQKIRIGDKLAAAMCTEGQYLVAISVLRNLRNIYESIEEQSPEVLRIRALLAHIHLSIGRLPEAVLEARFVYEQAGINNVLQYPIHHHCNTLITALSQQNQPDLFIEAKQIWQEIYDRYRVQNEATPVSPPTSNRGSNGPASPTQPPPPPPQSRRPARRQAPLTPKDLDDLREHIRIGRLLGDDWTASARSRDKKPRSGEKIQNQANELEDVLSLPLSA